MGKKRMHEMNLFIHLKTRSSRVLCEHKTPFSERMRETTRSKKAHRITTPIKLYRKYIKDRFKNYYRQKEIESFPFVGREPFRGFSELFVI